MNSKLNELNHAEKNYNTAFQLKKEHLLKSNTDVSHELFRLSELLGIIKSEKVEIEEAIEAGRLTEQALIYAEKKLGTASAWGIADILGGRMIITSIKHLYINDAKKGIKEAQKHLIRFQRELEDVNKTVKIDIGKFSTFADFIFDGVIFDFIVQSQINKAKDQVLLLRQNIKEMLDSLRIMLNENELKCFDIEKKKKEIIENS